MDNKKIKCPNCNYQFAVEEVLEKQLREKLQKDFQREKDDLNKIYAAKEEVLLQQQKELEEKKKKENELFKERLERERLRVKQEVELETQKSVESKISYMSEEMVKRENEIKKLKESELQMMKEAHELKRLKDEMEVRVQKELLEARQAIEEKTRREESEKTQLKMREYEKKMNDLTTQLEMAKKKAEQGSMQLQGEVMELVLEELLQQIFPYDTIAEVPKGVKGADVIQTVRNAFNQECGQIIYESKRTKAFSHDWIEKLKADQRMMGADMAVIVTETMPKEMDHFGDIKGVWICPFKDVRGVALLLREAVVRIHNVKSAQVNKGDKMEMLYHFLTGPEFRGNLEAIVEGFNNMQEDLNKERRAMERIWKTREKQIEKVIQNTIHMYGSIRGIAGNAVGTIRQLELPEGE